MIKHLTAQSYTIQRIKFRCFRGKFRPMSNWVYIAYDAKVRCQTGMACGEEVEKLYVGPLDGK